MAQDITLLGATYEDVPAVELPKSGGGTATFTDVSDTTATLADVMPGTYVYQSDGTRGEGTLANTTLGQGYGSALSNGATILVTMSGYELVDGGVIAVKFSYDVIAEAKLQVNGKTSRYIRHKGARIEAGVINAGDTAFFMYDGTYYYLLGVDRTESLIKESELDTLKTTLGLT